MKQIFVRRRQATRLRTESVRTRVKNRRASLLLTRPTGVARCVRMVVRRVATHVAPVVAYTSSGDQSGAPADAPADQSRARRSRAGAIYQATACKRRSLAPYRYRRMAIDIFHGGKWENLFFPILRTCILVSFAFFYL